MASTSTEVSSARQCDGQSREPHPAPALLSNPIQPQTTRASVARIAFGRAFAALALTLSAELLGASPAFATPPPATDMHGGLVATCAACHGAAGEGSSTRAIPRLAGQNADYLAHALAMVQDGTRASPVMQPVAQNLSDSDMRQLADYFAAQHPPLAQAVTAPTAAQLETGEQLAHAGDGATVAAC